MNPIGNTGKDFRSSKGAFLMDATILPLEIIDDFEVFAFKIFLDNEPLKRFF